MRLRIVSLLAVMAACSTPPSETAERRYIVVGTPSTDIGSEILAIGGVPERDLASVHSCTALLTPEAATALRTQDGIRLVEEDRLVSLAPPGACDPWPECKGGGDEEPPPPSGDEIVPWGIARTGADTVHGTVTGAGVRVVVNDTGIDASHPDLDVAGGMNFTSAKGGKPDAWKDDNGHGTHVAGTIAALKNGTGIVGMAPDAELWACKSLDRNGSGWLSDVVACIDWAVSIDADVINMSLGSSSPSAALESACDSARAAGVFLAVAAGNDGDGNPATDDVDYPGAYASTFAVGATDISDAPAWFTSDGPAVDVAAPGVDILSTTRGGGTGELSGTSMATPHNAGAAALLLGAGFSVDCAEIALQATAVDVGPAGDDVFTGAGRIDVGAALSYVCP